MQCRIIFICCVILCQCRSSQTPATDSEPSSSRWRWSARLASSSSYRTSPCVCISARSKSWSSNLPSRSIRPRRRRSRSMTSSCRMLSAGGASVKCGRERSTILISLRRCLRRASISITSTSATSTCCRVWSTSLCFTSTAPRTGDVLIDSRVVLTLGRCKCIICQVLKSTRLFQNDLFVWTGLPNADQCV